MEANDTRIIVFADCKKPNESGDSISPVFMKYGNDSD